MSSRVKTLVVAASLPFVVMAAVLLGVTAAFGTGMVRVYVDEKKPGGEHVHILVPAALVPVALHFVPDEKLRTASAGIQPWLPAVRAASEELARCPDGLLVEVSDGGERVSIIKLSGSLIIDVHSEKETVHVSLPLSVVSSVASRLEAIGPTRQESPFHF